MLDSKLINGENQSLLLLAALNLFEQFFEGKFVLGSLVIAQFDGSMFFGHNLANYSRKSFPFFFFTFLPVVLPEVIVWFEYGHYSASNKIERPESHDKDVVKNAQCIVGSLEKRAVVFKHDGAHSSQTGKRAFFELENFRAIRGASFREELQNRVDVLFTCYLAGLDGLHDLYSVLFGVTFSDPKR
jgi:hypothetical protein